MSNIYEMAQINFANNKINKFAINFDDKKIDLKTLVRDLENKENKNAKLYCLLKVLKCKTVDDREEGNKDYDKLYYKTDEIFIRNGNHMFLKKKYNENIYYVSRIIGCSFRIKNNKINFGDILFNFIFKTQGMFYFFNFLDYKSLFEMDISNEIDNYDEDKIYPFKIDHKIIFIYQKHKITIDDNTVKYYNIKNKNYDIKNETIKDSANNFVNLGDMYLNAYNIFAKLLNYEYEISQIKDDLGNLMLGHLIGLNEDNNDPLRMETENLFNLIKLKEKTISNDEIFLEIKKSAIEHIERFKIEEGSSNVNEENLKIDHLIKATNKDSFLIFNKNHNFNSL